MIWIQSTDKVVKLSSELMEETSYEVSSVLFWDDSENPIDPSRKAFEIIDGKIYLKMDTADDIELDTIAVAVKYKSGVCSFFICLAVGFYLN
jgi:hypothetical protein